jgi:hypothetical protein
LGANSRIASSETAIPIDFAFKRAQRPANALLQPGAPLGRAGAIGRQKAAHAPLRRCLLQPLVAVFCQLPTNLKLNLRSLKIRFLKLADYSHRSLITVGNNKPVTTVAIYF